MPEPLLYLKAMAAAAVVSMLVMLAAVRLRPRMGGGSRRCVVALAAGLAAGYYVLSVPVGWPPANALARLLAIVLPMVLLVELLCDSLHGASRLRRWSPWALRFAVAMSLPRILLHDSVYLSGPEYGWSGWQAAWAMLLCGTGTLAVWALLMRLADQGAPQSVLATLVMTILAVGMTVMLGGYLGGGTAALPLAASLIATTLCHTAWRRRGHAAAPANANENTNENANENGPAVSEWLNAGGRAILGLAVVGLFGLLYVGHFFGRLSLPGTIVLGLSPLLGWVTECPGLRHRAPRTRAALRIVLVAIPLAVLLGLAKHKFDRDLAPLM